MKSSILFVSGRLSAFSTAFSAARSVPVAAVLLLSLAGCGQRGPLYLPKPPEHPLQTTPAAQSTPAVNQSDDAAKASRATPSN
ncbi:putative small lipoprotein YifL [Herbaspirillum sp. Sphag1AN]|uniref:LPS translocon maturation chaperone LptM n=1 Tax=unclassified Herbaspirillum TaxID=2624150 RepID=UPI0017BF0ABA|nr:putative small lipoprotein YifL [Herbaspirillum sp. Sphag1AN]MBB3248012.1 putative small lipoprotein YifL [Herbaspirillum sp. Sphag64]